MRYLQYSQQQSCGHQVKENSHIQTVFSSPLLSPQNTNFTSPNTNTGKMHVTTQFTNPQAGK